MTDLDRRLHAARADLADLALKGRVEATRFVAGTDARVTVPSAPLRESPRPDARMLTEALSGETARIFETTPEGWAWVQLAGDDYVGWMAADALSPDAPPPTHKVAALRTLIFSGPDIKTPPIAALSLGAAVTSRGEAEDRNARYALIDPAGAIVAQHLAPLDAAETDWPGIAERFLETPYLWGGKTSFGIDCSGLVQVALSAAGFRAPRDCDMQEAALGAAVPLDAGLAGLRRGDLVFWKGHVGIMLDAGTLLHANAHHMAVVREPLRQTVDRLDAKGLAVASIRRIGGE